MQIPSKGKVICAASPIKRNTQLSRWLCLFCARLRRHCDVRPPSNYDSGAVHCNVSVPFRPPPFTPVSALMQTSRIKPAPYVICRKNAKVFRNLVTPVVSDVLRGKCPAGAERHNSGHRTGSGSRHHQSANVAISDAVALHPQQMRLTHVNQMLCAVARPVAK